LQQVPCVRGSPLLRFSLLILALIAAGVGIRRVTAARVPTESPVEPAMVETTPGTLVPFQLLLSAPAAVVEIDTGFQPAPHSAESSLVTGTLRVDAKNPHLSLMVRWKTPPAAGEHRFAKLTLEAPGQPTLTHVFDAGGDIDDFLELPLPKPHE
jgi:hypothetical protein